MNETPRMIVAAHLALLLLIGTGWLVGCAEGTTPVEASDTGQTNDLNQSPVDMGGGSLDLGMVDDGNPCGVCCPGELRCEDDSTAAFCDPSGANFVPRPCGEDEVCQDGECVVEPVCTPGATDCLDASTRLTCRSGGDGFTTSPCPEETTCFAGECGTGSPIGEACAEDDECISSTCRCGSMTDPSCPQSISQGFCSTSSCTADSCGQDGLCVVGDAVDIGVEGLESDFCVPRCGAGCGDGFECRLLPVRTEEGIAWEDGCYFDGMVDIGEECTSDLQCAAGECLQDIFNTGYCTRRCDQDGACPDRSACVELKSGQFHCSLLCGDGSVGSSSVCPLDVPDERFDVNCKILNRQEGGVARVCAGL